MQEAEGAVSNKTIDSIAKNTNAKIVYKTAENKNIESKEISEKNKKEPTSSVDSLNTKSPNKVVTSERKQSAYDFGYFLFGINNYGFTESHKKELDIVYAILKENPSIIVEVRGHTDSTGSGSVNSKLSKNRANKVANMLIAKGISKKRLIVKGYSSSFPIEPNTFADGKPNKEGMKMNRRVDFKIVSGN